VLREFLLRQRANARIFVAQKASPIAFSHDLFRGNDALERLRHKAT
jgi:hypothetical protein